jgi:20S proteasome alpha/beta subunit
MCEALWQPDMSPEEIFECIAQALTNALDRDASSGKYRNIFKSKKNSIYFSIFIYDVFFQF